jgi:hypothetical protein
MSVNKVELELRAVLDTIEAAFARGTTPDELMPMWYDDDIVVVGEGDPCVTRGFQALVAKATHTLHEMGPRPQVTFKVDSPILALETLAVAMIDAEICPDLPEALRANYRMMTAWRLGSRGWRIVREMFAVGPL